MKAKYSQRIIEKALQQTDLDRYRNFSAQKTKLRIEEWRLYAFYFLQASKKLTTILKSRKALDGYPNIDTRILIIPTLYNIRHTIELIIKYFYKALGRPPETNHNIFNQYELIKNQLSNRDNFNFASIAKEFSVKEDKFIVMVKKSIVDFSSIVSKYHYHFPLQESLDVDKFYVEDSNNELFRYPEAKNVQFSFNSIAALNMKWNEIDKLKRDLEVVEFTLRLFTRLFDSSTKEHPTSL